MIINTATTLEISNLTLTSLIAFMKNLIWKYNWKWFSVRNAPQCVQLFSPLEMKSIWFWGAVAAARNDLYPSNIIIICLIRSCSEICNTNHVFQTLNKPDTHDMGANRSETKPEDHICVRTEFILPTTTKRIRNFLSNSLFLSHDFARSRKFVCSC